MWILSVFIAPTLGRPSELSCWLQISFYLLIITQLCFQKKAKTWCKEVKKHIYKGHIHPALRLEGLEEGWFWYFVKSPGYIFKWIFAELIKMSFDLTGKVKIKDLNLLIICRPCYPGWEGRLDILRLFAHLLRGLYWTHNFAAWKAADHVTGFMKRRQRHLKCHTVTYAAFLTSHFPVFLRLFQLLIVLLIFI